MSSKINPLLSITCALALSLSAIHAHASSASAVGSLSESVGSSSTSIQHSSDSSSTHTRVAQGTYTVVEVAEVTQRSDMVRVRLQAAAPLAAPSFDLLLPRQTLVRAGVTVGDTVQAQHRAYGVAFATAPQGGQGDAFFLVLDDEWMRELDSRVVTI